MAFDDDLSEVEQVERIRAWWSENWAWLLSGIVLGIGLLVG
jgi:predicted negative regulator of RcsB-dependent stress response